MVCVNEKNKWTIAVYEDPRDDGEKDPAEFRPNKMNLKISRNQYDYCRAKFPIEVGEEVKKHTQFEESALNGVHRADVLYDGEPVQELLFRSDWVTYANDYTEFELKDVHYIFAEDTIDQNYNGVTVQGVYEDILEECSYDIIENVVYKLPNRYIDPNQDQREQLEESSGTNIDNNFNARDLVGDIGGAIGDGWGGDTIKGSLTEATFELGFNQLPSQKHNNTKDASFNFDDANLQKAIHKVNDEFSINSWIDRYGNLNVGFPSLTNKIHVAAPDDNRVWRYKDPQVKHPREPIKQAVVLGPWKDAPGMESSAVDQTKEVVGHVFNNKMGKEARVAGVATRPDVESGQIIKKIAKNSKKSNLENVAENFLRNKVIEVNRGEVEIDPNIGGTRVSNHQNLYPGDILHLVPNDNRYSNNITAQTGRIGDEPDNQGCGGRVVNNERYSVFEVQHNISQGGNWSMSADLGMYAGSDIETHIDFFDPRENEWIADDRISDDNELTGGSNVIFENN